MARRIRSKEILSTEELAEIGSVALESTECESVVEFLIWDLSGMRPNTGKHFTHGIQLNNRLELLSTLGKANLPESQHAEFVGIISELKDLNGKRNQVIHGSWGAWVSVSELLANPAMEVVAISRKRRLNTAPLELSAKALKGMPESIAAAVGRLRDFAEKAWPHLEAL